MRLALFAIVLCFGYILFLFLTLPDITDSKNLLAVQSTVITDRHGTELYRLFEEEDRTFIEGSTIPKHMKDAIVAIEDERFHARGCLDLRALARVVFRLGQAGGASTLTRQLARNALDLRQQNLLNRKLKELILGCQLERRYTKTELLELYLNWIPFGSNAYGIEQASQKFFGIGASELSVAQAAVLASLPQRPSYFNPYGSHVFTELRPEAQEQVATRHITELSQLDDSDITPGLLGKTFGTGSTTFRIAGRSELVLKKMEELEFISEQERLQALEELEEMEFQPTRENIRAPHFVLWVREQVTDIFGELAEEDLLERGGLHITTTLDWELQQTAEEAVGAYREDISLRFNAHNISLVALHPESREILAYVGNADYNDDEHEGKIDMARAPRQPGSSFKPFVYAAAFQKGYGPATVLYDVPTTIGSDEPQNFDGTFLGPLPIRKALGGSRNLPAIKGFFLAGGEEPILHLVSRMGAPSPLLRRAELRQKSPDGEYDYGWPLALGSAETPLLEMVHAYSTLAAGGTYKPVVSVLRITDRNGNILFEAKEDTVEERVLDERIAYQVTSILSDMNARPDNEYWRTVLSIPEMQAAAKTGTSNVCTKRDTKNLKDEDESLGTCLERRPDNLWTLGYTPNLVTGVWVGNAAPNPLSQKAESLVTAAPIWKQFLSRATRYQREEANDSKGPKEFRTEFSVPSGVIFPQVSRLSGGLPTECTPVHLRGADVFLQEAPPLATDSACVFARIDKVTGLLASDSCPKDAQEDGSFLVPTSLLPDRWPTWQEGVQEWVTAHMELWTATPDHSGSLLPLPIVPTEECDPALTPGRLEQPKLQITFPKQGGSVSYPSFTPQVVPTVGSRIRNIEYLVDGRRVASGTGAIGKALRMPRSVKMNGSHTLEVILTDKYFNQASDRVSFTFEEDTSAPTVRILSPVASTIDSGTEITIRAEARDNDGDVKYVEFFLSETLLTTKPKKPYEFKYVLDLPPGTYRLRAVAEDIGGNEGEDSIELHVQ